MKAEGLTYLLKDLDAVEPMYFLQALVIACEVMPADRKISAWRKEIEQWVKEVGTAVLVPVNHPNADGKVLLAMVKGYAEEVKAKP